jgi:hypothetical protein
MLPLADVLAFGLTLAACYGFHRWCERPFMTRRPRPRAEPSVDDLSLVVPVALSRDGT